MGVMEGRFGVCMYVDFLGEMGGKGRGKGKRFFMGCEVGIRGAVNEGECMISFN